MLVTQADIEARLGRTLTSDEQTAFSSINTALQNHIERLIGSDLETATEASRFYDGGVQNLPIDPCTDITAVAWVDEYENVTDTFDSDEITEEPRNQTLKQMIRRRFAPFPGGMNAIKVTAKFSIAGDAGVQNIVKQAMIDSLVSEITDTDNVKRESIEGYSIEYATNETKNNLSKISSMFPRII